MFEAIRTFSAGEIRADRLIHVVGISAAGLGTVALIALTAAGGHPLDLVPVSAYLFGLLAMLSFSAAYSLGRASPHRELLRRFDHSAIFVMIAGTYTPFTTLALSGGWAVGMTVLVWTIAALGVLVKMTVPQRRYEGFSVAMYLALGWSAVIAAGPLIAALETPVLILLATGGVVYSLGVIFHGWQRLPYQNAIWHLFVLVAAAIHFAAVCVLVA